MADIPAIPTVLINLKLAQQIAQNDSAIRTVLKGGTLDNRIGDQIYMARVAIHRRYTLNPSDPTLRDTINYAVRIAGNYYIMAQNKINGQIAGVPVITGPTNQSVTLGGTATFTITVTTTLLFTIAWYRNGVLIPGQTNTSLVITNAQLSDNGAVFNAIVTNSVGSTSSATASLTVSSTLSASYFYGDIDYYNDIVGGNDDISYNGSVAITSGQPISIPFPSGASNNKFNGIRYPISQGLKTTWFNTNLNQGQVPDSVYRSILTIGSFYYILSRNAMSLDTSQPVFYT